MSLFDRFAKRGPFRPARLVELIDDVPNPRRGWYRIAPYDLSESLDGASFVMPGDERDRLVLVRVGIGAYRDCALDDAALARLDRILSTWEEQQRDIIFRAAYDVEGFGYDAEPYDFATVLEHASQIGRVLARHAGAVLVCQGLLVGSWAEMHHSRYLATTRLREIYAAFRREVGPDLPIGIRTPRQIKQIADDAALGSSGRIALFNDGMMGSITDLATFGTTASGAELPQGTWLRADELKRLGAWGDAAPLGGEAVGKTEYSRGEHARSYMRACRVTYLNRTHDPATIARWARTPAPGSWPSMFAYIGAHLGYRFVCRGVRAQREDDSLVVQVDLANRGFARPFLALEPRLVVRGGQDVSELPLSGAPRSWEPACAYTLAARMPAPGHEAHLFLKLARDGGEPVRLANDGATDVLFLGTWSER